MKFARRVKQDVDINLTPLIDVVFLLLIFFMVSTTFIKDSHLTIELPEASSKATRPASEILEISIAKSGSFAVNGDPLVNNSPETLRRAIQAKSGGKTDAPLVITADAATPHQSVVTAMDIAGQLGFEHLSITTREREQD